jgi:xanthine dehydrogenase accessory factor
MRDILPEIERWQQDGEEIALATVIRATGSAPRPAGGKLAVTPSGRMSGSVSGGCVEGAVYELALDVLKSGRSHVAQYGISNELAWDVGLSCGGTIEVFVEPFQGGFRDAINDELRRAISQEHEIALASVVSGADIGAKLLVYADGRRIGSLGNPDLDEAVAADALDVIGQGGAETNTYPVGDTGIDVYIESYLPPRRLVIVGAAHIAIPLVNFARELGYRTTVIDARALFATRERFPHADELIVAWPDEALATLPLGPQTDIVLLAHDPKFETPALDVALRSRASYIGAIGSRKTSAERKERLRESGFSEERIARLHGPVGLDIGAKTPAEIAISILAEIIAVRDGRDQRRIPSRSAMLPTTAKAGGD